MYWGLRKLGQCSLDRSMISRFSLVIGFFTEEMSTTPTTPTIELVFQAVNVMVPVVTGYLILFVGAIGRLWELSSERSLRLNWRFAGFTVITGILSLGCWAGAMAFGIMWSIGKNSRPWWLLCKTITPKEALYFSRHLLGFGYSMFILSVILGIWTCWRSIRVGR